MRLDFDEKTHTYTLDGQIVPSVSQILQKMHISKDYSKVPKEIIDTARERGTIRHSNVEAYLNIENWQHDYDGDCLEVKQVRDFLLYLNAEREVKSVKTEQMVNYGIRYAGRFDLLIEQDRQNILVDFKSGEADRQAVSYQLSMYELALGKPCKLYCLERIGDERFNAFEVEKIPQEQILSLLDSFEQGDTLPIATDELQLLAVKLEEFAVAEAELKKQKAQIDKLKAKVMEAMQNAGLKKIENDVMRITVKEASFRESADNTLLKIKFPEVWEQVKKTSSVSGSLLVSLKEEKNDD